MSCRTIHRASRAGVTTEVICYLDILLDGTCATKYVTGTCNGDRYRKPLSRILHQACLFWSYIYIGTLRYIRLGGREVSKSSNPRTQSRSVKTPYTCNARVYVNADDSIIRFRAHQPSYEKYLYLYPAQGRKYTLPKCSHGRMWLRIRRPFLYALYLTTVLLLELQLINMRCRQTETSVQMRHQMCIGKQGRSLDV